MKLLFTAHCSLLTKTKNLLAFSAGIDSSALFFLLLESNIPFDIALVNYGTRANSDVEEAHAIALADTYGKKCYTVKAPQFKSNFEANARAFRYGYFEEIITKEGYDVLLTAHQLNDRLEWFLMRLAKGAGVSELTGMEVITDKTTYQIIRPLLHIPKTALQRYMDQNNFPYFIDESNQDEKYERNRFRKEYADTLIESYADGIARSFSYLERDKQSLNMHYEVLYAKDQLRILRLYAPEAKAHAADKMLKMLGYLLSAAQRKEIQKENSIVIGGKWAVEVQNNLLYIAPYITENMSKSFKEKCRVHKIPAKVRGYCYVAGIEIEKLKIKN